HLAEIFPEVELAANEDLAIQEVHISEIVTAQCEAQEIINLTDSSNIQQLAQDYLDNDEFIATEKVMDDNRIIELISNSDVEENNDNPVEEEEPRITFTEVKKNINLLLKFIRQQSLQPDSFIKETDETFFRDFLSRTHRASTRLIKQGTLEDFLTSK
ncbi:11386_t:CDS:1, partial [Cetraspora pellucida]